MNKRVIFAALALSLLAGCGASVEKAEPVVEVESEPVVSEPEPEMSDAERLGVSEKLLGEIEHIMGVAGYEYTREDITRIYRLTPEQMTLNPSVFAEYDVTVSDGTTHHININLDLIGEV